MVSTLAGQSRFGGKSGVAEAAIFDRDAAAKHNGDAHAWPCVELHDGGHPGAPRADARIRSPLVTRNGSCGNWNPDGRREISSPDRKQNPTRSRSRRIFAESAGVAG